ncbi:FAD/NAD(P)-binding protein [Mesonia sp.]|uniref:FAD/NAD(P)-binding protein n=1 Tax=Mesonia sp. TaxID=1960830 RepID=UPI001771B3BF|nr:FAD/NAD(P)-binding protein [Mesonia sp.]HIB37098.1 hypothetical protein [Mesonia sp.]HIO26701.1 hypothetical protein [Flavobacteriaceae bacterium]
MKNITIVGGGACGSAVFIELVIQILAEKLQDKVSLTLIERAEKVGYGLAFGTQQESHLLNTQADLMGIFAEEPEHFATWLNEKREKTKNTSTISKAEETYTSRQLYGDYVAEQLSIFKEKAKRGGIQVDYIHDEAIHLEAVKNEELKIDFEGRESITSAYVILALGTPKPNNFKECEAYPEFINFPWPVENLKRKVKKNDTVGVLGTSLSAIDTVLTLIDQEHQGNIKLISPEGLLPRVQPIKNEEIDRKFITLSNIHQLKRDENRKPKVKELFKLFMQEVEALEGFSLDWNSLKRDDRSAEELMEIDIYAAENNGDSILNLAYALRHDASTIWSWLSVEQKKHFGDWIGKYWQINRHAMPLHNAYKLKKLMEKDQLEVIGDFKEVNYLEDEGFEIKLNSGDKFKVDKLVNATGTPSEVESMENTLIQDLLQEKLIIPYEVGGIYIDERTMRVVTPQKDLPIYALGHINNGMLLDVNSVWFNVKSSMIAAKDILFKIQMNERIS